MNRIAAGGIALGVLALGAVVGRWSAPSPDHPRMRAWYRRLDKPGFTPPDAVFGAVWPVLEVGLTVGGYRLLRRPADARRTVALGLWAANMAAIGGWSALFFRGHRLGASAVAAGAMMGAGSAYALAARPVDRVAAATAVPYVAWLGFATVLAERVWARNA